MVNQSPGMDCGEKVWMACRDWPVFAVTTRPRLCRTVSGPDFEKSDPISRLWQLSRASCSLQYLFSAGNLQRNASNSTLETRSRPSHQFRIPYGQATFQLRCGVHSGRTSPGGFCEGQGYWVGRLSREIVSTGYSTRSTWSTTTTRLVLVVYEYCSQRAPCHELPAIRNDSSTRLWRSPQSDQKSREGWSR
jgi:hypothetical protein